VTRMLVLKLGLTRDRSRWQNRWASGYVLVLMVT